MKLRTLLNMYNNVSSATISLHLDNRSVILVSPNLISCLDSSGEVAWRMTRSEKDGIIPWVELRDRFGAINITDFTITENQLILWEKITRKENRTT